MQGQHNAYRQLLSEPRLQPYLLDADQDLEKAWATYLWTNELAGALHALIALVEVAVRNSLDRELSNWNACRSGERAWTLHGNAEEPLYSLVRGDLHKARKAAKRAAQFRASEHPRYGAEPTHDDVVAQLMFGTWVKLLHPMSKEESPQRQQQLWTEALQDAFPGMEQTDAGRQRIGQQLDSIRRLRNRVAHHDNLLRVKVNHRLNEMLSLVQKINPDYPQLIIANSRVRQIARKDPRNP